MRSLTRIAKATCRILNRNVIVINLFTHYKMAESSPELPKQRPKPQLPASALQDSSSPAPARRIKIKRIVSPAVPAQSAPAAKGHKKRLRDRLL
jgi:hypothetical protein